MSALEDEPMSGAEFKMHTTDGDKIHTSATNHLMELWPGVSRKFCGKLMITIERKICAFTFGGTNGTNGSTTAADLPESFHTRRRLIQSLDSNTGTSGVRYERTRRRTNVRSRVQDAHD